GGFDANTMRFGCPGFEYDMSFGFGATRNSNCGTEDAAPDISGKYQLMPSDHCARRWVYA
ncbi:MAG: hypothetical protein ACREQ4_16930, partial [Candidatus Binataceae bacterium]